jgi:predicted peroxiredoxin
LSNEKYKRKYGIDNPNIPLIKELQTYGVKMIVCGQAMTFYRLEMEELVPGIKKALTAQTVLSFTGQRIMCAFSFSHYRAA